MSFSINFNSLEDISPTKYLFHPNPIVNIKKDKNTLMLVHLDAMNDETSVQPKNKDVNDSIVMQHGFRL